MKHTPGPWTVQFEREATNHTEDHRHDILDSQAKYLGRFTRSGMTDYEESKANARLIAAAPELLEALEHTHTWLCEHFGDIGDGSMECLCQEVEAAIAKAKGE